MDDRYGNGFHGYNASLQIHGTGNESLCDFHPNLPLRIQIILYVELVISVVGVLGNLLCIIILCHRSQRHLVKTPFLVSVAVSDMLILCFVVFMPRLKYMFGLMVPGPLGWCNIGYFVGFGAIGISGCSLGLFTVNRALSVNMPLKYMTMMPARMNLGLLFSVWTISLALHVPCLLATEADACCIFVKDYEWVIQQYRPVLQLTVMSFLPITVIVLGNVSIAYRLCQMRHSCSERPVKDTSRDDPYGPVVGMCVGLGVFHVLTRLPLLVYIVEHTVSECTHSDQLYSSISYLFSTINHAGNFVIYTMLSPTFRKTMKLIFRLDCRASIREWCIRLKNPLRNICPYLYD